MARERVVILTWEPDAAHFWLTDDYSPELVATDRAIFPTRDELERSLGPVELRPLPVPHDCLDGFLGAYWRRPQAYLDPAVRGAISTFGKIGDVEPGLARLRRDLEDGTWPPRHGPLLTRPALDLGYRLPSPIPLSPEGRGQGEGLEGRRSPPRPRKPRHDRRKRLHVPLEDGEIRDTVPLPPLAERLADLLDGAHQQVRGLEHDVAGRLESGRELIHRHAPLIGHRDRLDQRVELERVEAIPGAGADPLELLPGRGRAQVGQLEPAAVPSRRRTRPMIVASRAARVSVRRPPPPIAIGGCGRSTEAGRPSSSAIV